MDCTPGTLPMRVPSPTKTGKMPVAKRPLTLNYIIFYLLFLPDTWQCLAGILMAWLAVPRIIEPDMGRLTVPLLYIMCATIGYAVFRIPGKWISNGLRKLILGNKHPG